MAKTSVGYQNYGLKTNGKTMAKKVYISLPIAHYDLEERRAYAQKIEDMLKCFYEEVVNPLKNGIDAEAHWSIHMRKDIQDLLQCDAIYMCQDWQWSHGCKLEHDVATSCGIEVKYEKDSWKPNNLG